MAIPKKVLKLVQQRDDHCWHCGVEEDLVPHHVKNRGMGGSKLLDTVDNLAMMCARWNGDMESSVTAARQARAWNHKQAVWEREHLPLFDVQGGWWYLHADGSKTRATWKDSAF
jgi:hypothetical protein